MDKIKELLENELNQIVVETNFNKSQIIKDYYITMILYIIKDVKGIYFKGGTALHKIFLNYSRLSEDIDLTITRDLEKVRDEITKRLKEAGIFTNITKDKHVEGFIRLVVNYNWLSKEEGVIFIDINKRAKLILEPEINKINHFYPDNIPEFSFNCVAKKEMIAGKIMAAIGRNKSRDHYDIYEIIKAGLPIDMDLVKKKSELSKEEFSIIKMFNKAKILKNRWDQDMDPLIANRITFQEVMQTLAKYFKLKEQKEEIKDKTQKRLSTM